MRLFADGLLSRTAAIGSPGLDELRWLKPVCAGDSLDARVEILEVRPSRSRLDRGAARIRCVVRNQRGDEVLTMFATVMFLRRPIGAR
jgi:acyl dehydratase